MQEWDYTRKLIVDCNQSITDYEIFVEKLEELIYDLAPLPLGKSSWYTNQITLGLADPRHHFLPGVMALKTITGVRYNPQLGSSDNAGGTIFMLAHSQLQAENLALHIKQLILSFMGDNYIISTSIEECEFRSPIGDRFGFDELSWDDFLRYDGG